MGRTCQWHHFGSGKKQNLLIFGRLLLHSTKALTLTENGFVKNLTFKLCLEQTAQGKMTARTIGSFHAFRKKRDFLCIYPSNLTFGVPPLFSFSLIINSFHRDLMWEALIFSKDIVLVFSKVGASRRIRPHIRPPYLRWAIDPHWSFSGRVYLLFLE